MMSFVRWAIDGALIQVVYGEAAYQRIVENMEKRGEPSWKLGRNYVKFTFLALVTELPLGQPPVNVEYIEKVIHSRSSSSFESNGFSRSCHGLDTLHFGHAPVGDIGNYCRTYHNVETGLALLILVMCIGSLDISKHFFSSSRINILA
jgi:hypothetical protein